MPRSFSHPAQERDDNLIFVRERLLRPPPASGYPAREAGGADRASLLDLYGKVRSGQRVAVDDTNQLVSVLRLAGITRIEEARPLTPSPLHPFTPAPQLRVRNRIYARVFDREWVAQHMPDAEVRRQKAAYRRGLLRAASVAAVIVAVVAGLALTATSQARRADRNEQEARQEARRAQGLAAELGRALTEKEKAFRQLQASVKVARRESRRASREAGRARVAQAGEAARRAEAEAQQRRAQDQERIAVAQRARAEGEQKRAERQTGIAEQKREESRQRLLRLTVANGTRLVDEGDLLGALLWFTEALRLDQGHPSREAIHRMRIGAVLRQCPRLVRAWFPQDSGAAAQLSRDGGRAGENRPGVHALSQGATQISPDGRRVVTMSPDGTARVWDLESGKPITPPLRHRGIVNSAAFSLDGQRLVTASGAEAGEARVWDARVPSGRGAPITPPMKYSRGLYRVLFSADGRRVVTIGVDGTARVWDAATAEPLTPFLLHGAGVWRAEFTPNGHEVVTASGDGTVRVWETGSGAPAMPPIRHSRPVTGAEFSPDGRRLVTASANAARVWDAVTGLPVTLPLLHDDGVSQAAFSPDGQRLVTASGHVGAGASGEARVWDVRTGRQSLPPLKHSQTVVHASFSPDGRRAVTASADGTARVWDAATGRPITAPLRHSSSVEYASFSPDSRRVVTASADQTARVWDGATGQPLTAPMGHNGAVSLASFSPDGRLVVTVSADRAARVWDAATGEPVTPPLKHDDSVRDAAFSPDSRRLVTASGDWTRPWGQARVWNLPYDVRPVADLILLSQLLTGHRIDSTAGLTAVEPPALRRAWQALRSRYPSDFAASRARLRAWQDSEAERAERTGRWTQVAAHLDRLCESAVGDPTGVPAGLYVRRANACAELRQWDRAVADYREAVGEEAEDPRVWQRLALAQLASGDQDGSRQTCAAMLSRFERTPSLAVADAVARTCALSSTTAADPERLVRLAGRAAAGPPGFTPYADTLGAALYRAGKFDEVVRRLSPAQASRSSIVSARLAANWLFLAMAHYRLGHGAEARQWLDKAVRWIDENAPETPLNPATNALPWDQRWQAHLLRREAEALLGSTHR